MEMQRISCQSCGASIEWDGRYGKPVTCSYCGSTFLPAASPMQDVWMMTDPVARARYEFEGSLDELEHDIRFEVMRGGDWTELDRAYAREIERLEAEGKVRRLASFWAISPHPPVFRALEDGSIRLGAASVSFGKGDEIVWACPMTRDQFSLDLPVLIGDFQDERTQRLCGVMASAMQGRMA